MIMEIATKKLTRITNEIDRLNPAQQLSILSHIVTSIKREVIPRTSTNLTALQGLGKELWANVDVEDYVSNERSTWN
jgi:hypothetical protein